MNLRCRIRWLLVLRFPPVPGVGQVPGALRGTSLHRRHLRPTGGPAPVPAGGTAEKLRVEEKKEAKHLVRSGTGRSRRRSKLSAYQVRVCTSERGRSAVRFPSPTMHLIRWLSLTVYVSFEFGTARVPGERGAPEGIAVILCTSLRNATFEVCGIGITSEDLYLAELKKGWVI